VKRELMQDLRSEIEALIAHGPRYALEYIDTVREGKATRPRPDGLHAKSAQLIRELALDLLVAQR
jgi:hypothetical protein